MTRVLAKATARKLASLANRFVLLESQLHDATPIGTRSVSAADLTHGVIGWASHHSATFIQLKLNGWNLLSTVLGRISSDSGAVSDRGEQLDLSLLAIDQLQDTAIT